MLDWLFGESYSGEVCVSQADVDKARAEVKAALDDNEAISMSIERGKAILRVPGLDDFHRELVQFHLGDLEDYLLENAAFHKQYHDANRGHFLNGLPNARRNYHVRRQHARIISNAYDDIWKKVNSTSEGSQSPRQTA